MNFLWQRPQPQLLQEMISWEMHAVLVKVAALGLGRADVGKSIKQQQQKFRLLDKSFGFHQCGEGGEYETLVLDCPLYFFFSLSLDEWDLYTHSSDDVAPVVLLQPRSHKLVPKAFSGVNVHHDKHHVQHKHHSTESWRNEENLQNTRGRAATDTLLLAERLPPGFIGDVAPPCCYSSSLPAYPACMFLRRVRSLAFYFPARTWHIVTCAAAVYKDNMLYGTKENVFSCAGPRKKQITPLFKTTSSGFAAAGSHERVLSPASETEPRSFAGFLAPTAQESSAAVVAATTARAAGLACAASRDSTHMSAARLKRTIILPQCLNAHRYGNRLIINLDYLPRSVGTAETAVTCVQQFVAADNGFERQTSSCDACLNRLQSSVVAALQRLLPAAAEATAEPSSSNWKYSIGSAVVVYNKREFHGRSSSERDRCSCFRNSSGFSGCQSNDQSASSGSGSCSCSSSSSYSSSGVYDGSSSGSNSNCFCHGRTACHTFSSNSSSDRPACEPLSSGNVGNGSRKNLVIDHTHSDECSSTVFTTCGEVDVIPNRLVAAAALTALSSVAKQPFAVVSLSLPFPTPRYSVRILIDILDAYPVPLGRQLSCHLWLPLIADLSAGDQELVQQTCVLEQLDLCPSDSPLATPSHIASTSRSTQSAPSSSAVTVANNSVARLPQAASSDAVLSTTRKVAASSSHAAARQWQVSALRFLPEQHLFTRGLNLWVPPIALLPHSSQVKAVRHSSVSPHVSAAIWYDGVVQEKRVTLATRVTGPAEGDARKCRHFFPCYGNTGDTYHKEECYRKEEARSGTETWPMALPGSQHLQKSTNNANGDTEDAGRDLKCEARGFARHQRSVRSSNSSAGMKYLEADNEWPCGFRFKCCQAVRCRRQRVQYVYAQQRDDHKCTTGERDIYSLCNTNYVNYQSSTSRSDTCSCSFCCKSNCCHTARDGAHAASDCSTDKKATQILISRREHTFHCSLALRKAVQCQDFLCGQLCGYCSAGKDEVTKPAASLSGARGRGGSIRLLSSEPEVLREDETSQLLVGGVFGRVPHSNEFPMYSSLAAGPEVYEGAVAKTDVTAGRITRAATSSTAAGQPEKIEAAVVVDAAATTTKESEAVAKLHETREACKTATASALAESLAVEVAMAARNLQQTIRLCGGGLAAAECGVTAMEEDAVVTTGESDSDGERVGESAVVHGEATSNTAENYNTELAPQTETFPLSRPPPLLFAFLSREALDNSELSNSNSPEAAAEFGDDAGTRQTCHRTADGHHTNTACTFDDTQPKMQTPLEERLLQPEGAFIETSVFMPMLTAQAVLQSMKVQLQRHLLPRTEGYAGSLQPHSRTEERSVKDEHSSVWKACRRAGIRGEGQDSKTGNNLKEGGGEVDAKGRADTQSSAVEGNSLGDCKSSSAYYDGHLSEMLVVPAMVDGNLQGGGKVLLWPLGVRGPFPLQAKTETKQLRVKDGAAVPALVPRGSIARADCENAETAEEVATAGSGAEVPHVKQAAPGGTGCSRQKGVVEGREESCMITEDMVAGEMTSDGQVRARDVREMGIRQESSSRTSHEQERRLDGSEFATLYEKKLFYCRKRDGRTFRSDCIVSLELVMQRKECEFCSKRKAGFNTSCERRSCNDACCALPGVSCERHQLKNAQQRYGDSSYHVGDLIVKSSANAFANSRRGFATAVTSETSESSECGNRVATTQAAEPRDRTNAGNLTETAGEVLVGGTSSLANASSGKVFKNEEHPICSNASCKREEAVMAADANLTERGGDVLSDEPAPLPSACDDGLFEDERRSRRRDLSCKREAISSIARWRIRVQEVALLPCRTVPDDDDEGTENNERQVGVRRAAAFSLDVKDEGPRGGQRLEDSPDPLMRENALDITLLHGSGRWDLGRFPAEWGAAVISLIPEKEYISEITYGDGNLNSCVGVDEEKANIKNKHKTTSYSKAGPHASASTTTQRRGENLLQKRIIKDRDCAEDFAGEETYSEVKNALRVRIQRKENAWKDTAGSGHWQGLDSVISSGRHTSEVDVRHSRELLGKPTEDPGEKIRDFRLGEEPLLTALTEKVIEAIFRIAGYPFNAGSVKRSKEILPYEERDNTRGDDVILQKRSCSAEHPEDAVKCVADEDELVFSSFPSYPVDDLVVYVLYVCSRIKEVFTLEHGRSGERVDIVCSGLCWEKCGTLETHSSCGGPAEAVSVGDGKLGGKINTCSCLTYTGEDFFHGEYGDFSVQTCGKQKQASKSESTRVVNSGNEEGLNEVFLPSKVQRSQVRDDEQKKENKRSVTTVVNEKEHQEGNSATMVRGGQNKTPCCYAAQPGQCHAAHEVASNYVGSMWESCFRQRLSTAFLSRLSSLELHTKKSLATPTRTLEGEQTSSAAYARTLQGTGANAPATRRTQQTKFADKLPASQPFEGPAPDATLPRRFIPQSFDLPVFFFPVSALENDAVVQVVVNEAP